MIHYVERSVEPRYALKIDAAVEKPGTIEIAAEYGPVKPVLTVV